uniref:HNH endonuclease family protein n=1 Tax=Streptomyces sp. SAT1 TaxID=1849967 RepID=UPI0007F9C06B|nr:HNH endonuclease family protein [Streptomyces sp. SAT1]ANO42837.1 hypothetical protein A8713_036970 [Streptomyces sp. SAT1]
MTVTAGAVLVAVAGCSDTGGGASAGAGDGKPSAAPTRGAGGGRQTEKPALPGLPTASAARKELAGLKTAAPASMRGYSRAKFPHWAEQGEHCDTRETVLGRDGTAVKRDAQCRAVSGKWVSVYDGKKATAASQLDIDHTVPLANAWRSGATAWTQEQRKAFANDLAHPQLLAVSASSNRQKGDQSPDQWAPPLRSYWCTYARSWVSVKSTYRLTITTAERTKLTEMLDTCS